MLVDVDKEGAASVSFNDFIQMVTPKILARDPKVQEELEIRVTVVVVLFALCGNA